MSDLELHQCVLMYTFVPCDYDFHSLQPFASLLSDLVVPIGIRTDNKL